MIRPIKNRVLLKPIPNPTISDGGIHIPFGATDNLQSQFVVLARGPKAEEVLPGQRVLCNTYAGTEIMVDDKPHRLVEQSSILAILSVT